MLILRAVGYKSKKTNQFLLINMKKLKVTRQEIYDMVWNEPLSSITKRYTTTYPELRKVLTELDIPIPENGHWSKLKFGKQVEIKPLPEDYTGKNEVELIEKEIIDIVASKEDKVLINVVEEDRNNIFKVPKKLTHPDILIESTKEYFDAGERFFYRSGYRIPERNDVLDIDTTKNTFQRALRIMDTIIKILRNRGHDVEIKRGKTLAVIYGQEIEIRLREKHRVVDEPRNTYRSRNLEPTGVLSFMIEPRHYHEKVINEGQDLLETKLKSIVQKLEALGSLKREEHIKNEEWHRQYEEQQRIEKEWKEKKKKERKEFKAIFGQAYRLYQSNFMRTYISRMEETLKQRNQLTEDLKNWLTWAKAKIDWYDPLINRDDDILDDDDKDKIFKDLIEELGYRKISDGEGRW
ncbi:MAG: hypothetical protein GYA36_18880 [Veillonellaceae bacterium]|nr:hypothetical protein [Veillonellaceae bacterium]